MSQTSARVETIDLLQELGLKEYEARCFVALTRLSTGTATEISEISEVPRTRVYDAIDVIEELGLVEVQYGNPKRFRAVSVEEAAHTLRHRHENRITTLESQLHELEPPDDALEDVDRQEVWSLTGPAAIQNRTEDLVAEADSEVLLLVVEEELLTDSLADRLQAAHDRGATVIVGSATPAISEHVEEAVPGAQVFETGLDWLRGSEADEVAISRVLMTDRETLLVGSFYPYTGDTSDEQAIYANGLYNGVVVLLRRLITTGLLPARDAGT